MESSYLRDRDFTVRPRGMIAAIALVTIIFVSAGTFAQGTTARHLPNMSSYICDAPSQSTPTNTRYIGQVIKGQYNEWYESYVFFDSEQRLACISVIKPASRQLSADEEKTFLIASYNVGAPSIAAATERSTASASELEPASPENILPERLKHLREPAASSNVTAGQKSSPNADLPPLLASKTFDSNAPSPATGSLTKEGGAVRAPAAIAPVFP